ncbi:MAG: hypothetical protein IJW32_03665 [Clostridia bacterium]|nr:hypothetical protein [Clostridia bacterium]
MEEKVLTNAVSYDDSWLSMPFTGNWKETYYFAKNNIKDNFNKKLASHIVDDIKAVLYHLVHDGNTYEDMVLNTAVLYLLVKKTGYDINLIQKKYDKFTYEGVKLLLDRENPDYLKNTFENDDFAYLNKIKLAEYIASLNKLTNSKDVVEKTRKKKLVEYVVKTFEGKTHRGLMTLLKQTLKDFN